LDPGRQAASRCGTAATRSAAVSGAVVLWKCAPGVALNCGADALDRDRGDNRSSAPPTPPYVRFRIRRFELVMPFGLQLTTKARARRIRRLALLSTWLD